MTVALAIVSTDGVVVAADSRTSQQLLKGSPVRVLSDYTHKVFKVGEHAIATYGWAFLEDRNIAGHMTQFAAETKDCESPADLAERLATFFGERIDRHIDAGRDKKPEPGENPLGFLVGGIEDGVGASFEVLLPSRDVHPWHDTANPGAVWRGQTDVIRRLVKGFDLENAAGLAALAGKTAEWDALRTELQGLEYIIPFGTMNLQDAVDFAVFLIRTTIDAQRLTHGIGAAPGSWPGVGGPIEIAVVTPHEGFRWLQRTALQGERPAGEAEFSGGS